MQTETQEQYQTTVRITASSIFAEIDKAIELCKCPNPKNWNDSQFRIKYEEIKRKWAEARGE